MESDTECRGWLEDEQGARIPIEGSVSIGRAPTNTLVLEVEGVSRSHSMIHAREHGEFWLVDLGSRNGTWLNARRILQPVRLRAGDRIGVASRRFLFRQSSSPEEAISIGTAASDMEATIAMPMSERLPFWLLIADIHDFTGLSQSLSGEQLSTFVSEWVLRCKTVVGSHHGRINKFLGDGFFAVWDDADDSAGGILKALQGLCAISAQGEPAFRLVVHRGLVSVGGSPLLSEESFIGADVNFAFRMEKLAGALGESPLISEAAAARLSPLVSLRELPPQQLKGFTSTHRFFALA